MIPAEALRARFATSFAKRLADLHDVLDRGDLATAERAFHSLAGIGGTYGFPMVTTIARRGEEQCAAARTPEVKHLLEKLMEIALTIR
jgi:HPt (histidine-containing phosphotransfer) domain-containing protein